MRRFNKLGATALLAVVPVACQEGGPLEVPTPQMILTETGAVPTPEEIDLCKEGGSGTYTFNYSYTTVSTGAVTNGTVDVDSGSCVRVGLFGSTGVVMSITEVVPAGHEVVSITVDQLSAADQFIAGPTNTVSGILASGRPSEGAVVTFTNRILPPPGGGQGCTPGYWKQKHHFDSWVGYAPADDFDATFGVDAFSPNITLSAAAGLGGGGIKALARHAVAALLNATNPDVSYLYSEAEVIAMVQAAVASGNYEATKNLFEAQNEKGCPLN